MDNNQKFVEQELAKEHDTGCQRPVQLLAIFRMPDGSILVAGENCNQHAEDVLSILKEAISSLTA